MFVMLTSVLPVDHPKNYFYHLFWNLFLEGYLGTDICSVFTDGEIKTLPHSFLTMQTHLQCVNTVTFESLTVSKAVALCVI